MMTSPQASSALDFLRPAERRETRGKTMLQTRDLSVLGYANGFTLWHFITHDPTSQLYDPGYFDEAAYMFRPGDLILANVHQSTEDIISFLLSITGSITATFRWGKLPAILKKPSIKIGGFSSNKRLVHDRIMKTLPCTGR